jgi:hypothetical protein
MYQSSPRNNFLDTLIDPTTIALLGSIALHALIGASLPFFKHPAQDIKKADPGTVKTVELTPSELQRIPQAPPTPAPQVFTPPPTTPSPKVVAQPSIPPISPNSPTIPFSPIRIPLEQIKPQPPKGTRDQPAIPQPQPTTPIFDPKLSRKPKSKSKQPTPDKLKLTPVPSPPQIVTKPKLTTPVPANKAPTDDDGGDFQPVTPATTPSQSAQSTSPTRPAGGSSQTKPPIQISGQSTTSSSGSSGGDGNSSFPYPYGKYAAAVTARIAKYMKTYPGIKVYNVTLLAQSYPPNVPCSKTKQAPFSVLMVAFDKVPDNADSNALGTTSAPSIDEPYVATERDTPDNRKLGESAINAALYDANKADQNRLAEDKGKRVLYQYRVQFDPTTCKQ